ncbi:MAG TPA: hypothetical protein EYP53_08920 [Candidatus Latescibacteria bacterium]|nr:hypothetical protein [Candidatus Latescibacterota bacterium]
MKRDRMSRIITLTTDFGTRDGYAGAMKGVILRINPEVWVVDVTHEIEPHDIAGAAFVIAGAYRYFPEETVHLVVVDPGVGGERRPIIVRTEDYLFVGPDNGVFSLIYRREKRSRVIEISNPDLMLPEVSDTFHGRDIFAPAAAHMSKGVELSRFGKEITDYVQIPFDEPRIKGDRLEGQIIHIDRFGNLITNLSRDIFEAFVGERNFRIEVESKTLNRVCRSYSEVREGELLVIFGSLGLLELSVNCGNAAELLRLRGGERIIVERA